MKGCSAKPEGDNPGREERVLENQRTVETTSWRRHPACRAATLGGAGELRSPLEIGPLRHKAAEPGLRDLPAKISLDIPEAFL